MSDLSSHIEAQVITNYTLLCVAFRFLTSPDLSPIKMPHLGPYAVFGAIGGPLKHARETGNFREFHTVAGGNFLISEREFPVALV